jgi:hypothetical protein
MSIAMATLVVVSLCAVCASTSVSAATSSSSNVQSGLVGAPIPAGSAPAVCWTDPWNVYLFVKGTDNALWYIYLKLDDSHFVSEWTSLGGYITSDPSAAYLERSTPNTGTIDVLVRGGDGAIYEQYTDLSISGSGWSGWHLLYGQLPAGTGPAICAVGKYPNQRIDVFATGMDHALWHSWTDSSGYHKLEPLGGYLTSSPAARMSSTNNIIDISVYARGGDGACWQNAYNTYYKKWSGWSSFGGRIAPGTAPATAAIPGYYQDIFVQGMNGALWHNWKTPAYAWSGWQSLGGKMTSSPAATIKGSQIDVFVRGDDGYLWYIEYTSKWWDWVSFIYGGPP